MYYTPGWGMLVTGVVGVVGVSGTLAAAWITQHQTNARFDKEQAQQSSRFVRERRDRHYQDQRAAIADVLALANRVVSNCRSIAHTVQRGVDAVGTAALEAATQLGQDAIEKPLVLARARLIIDDADVLSHLGRLDEALGEASNILGNLQEDHLAAGHDLSVWSDELRTALGEIDRRSEALVSLTRDRLWTAEL